MDALAGETKQKLGIKRRGQDPNANWQVDVYPIALPLWRAEAVPSRGKRNSWQRTNKPLKGAPSLADAVSAVRRPESQYFSPHHFTAAGIRASWQPGANMHWPCGRAVPPLGACLPVLMGHGNFTVAGPFWPAPITAPGLRLKLREATLHLQLQLSKPTLLLTLCFVLANMLKGSNGIRPIAGISC